MKSWRTFWLSIFETLKPNMVGSLNVNINNMGENSLRFKTRENYLMKRLHEITYFNIKPVRPYTTVNPSLCKRIISLDCSIKYLPRTVIEGMGQVNTLIMCVKLLVQGNRNAFKIWERESEREREWGQW